MPAFDIDSYVGRSRAVDLAAIDWAAVPRYPVPPEALRTMRFMQDIESHTIIYLRSLLATRAIDDPDVATFLACWVYEETFHGLALQRFLQAAGTPVGARPLPRGQEPWAKRVEAAATAMVSKAWPRLLRGAHDLGRDQRAHHAHRVSASRRADRPPGAGGSARADRARRVATLLLLLPPGRAPPASPRGRADRALPGRSLLGPGGQRGPARRRAALPGRAISSAARKGRAAARKVDETIRRLPGFETVRLLESWMDRHAGAPMPALPRAHKGDAMATTTTTERPTADQPPPRVRHYRAYRPRPFTRAERDKVTILFGGLHWRAERDPAGGAGEPRLQARRSCRRRRARICSPGARSRTSASAARPASPPATSPTSCAKEAQAIGAEEVSKKYVYLTAGSCGACRFGQYHQSYELALRNSGLESFRMFLLGQEQLDQGAATGGGLDLNLPLTLGMRLGDRCCTDVVQDLEYQTRPYEVEAGRDRARWSRSRVEYLYEAFRKRPRRGKKWRVARLAPHHRLLRQRDARGAATLRRDRGRPPAREADGEDHRRVLPADRRGRSQLQHPPLARGGGRRGLPGRRSRSGSTTCCAWPAQDFEDHIGIDRGARLKLGSDPRRRRDCCAGPTAACAAPWATCRTSCRTSTSCAGWPRLTSTAG